MRRSYASFIIPNQGVILRTHVGMLTSVSNQGVTNGILQWPTPSQKIIKPPQESTVQPMLHCLGRRTRWHWQRLYPRWYKIWFCHYWYFCKSNPSENHTSAKPGSTLYHQATEQVLKEIQMGHYEVVPTHPEIISPMGVIPKPDGGVRLIHDCSQPPGKSVNDYCTTDWKQKFSSR